jgi:transcriptional regulator with XRE-family HTH domain
MMTNPARTARQQLADVIKFLRKDRNLDLSQAASMAGTSPATFSDWEDAKSIPDNRSWERLKKIVNFGFKSYEDLWRQARTEEDLEKSRPTDKTAPLTQRPFARLLVVANPKPPEPKVERKKPGSPPPLQPEPEVVTKEEPTEKLMPEKLVGVGYDLQPAYVAVNQLPVGWNTKLASQERADYARELLQAGTPVGDVANKVREKFKVGISASTVSAIRESLKNKGLLPKVEKKEKEVAPPPVVEKKEEAVPAAPKKLKATRTPIPVKKEINDQDVKAAVELLLEAVPNLIRFTVIVDESGEVMVDYKVKEVRALEVVKALKIR